MVDKRKKNLVTQNSNQQTTITEWDQFHNWKQKNRSNFYQILIKSRQENYWKLIVVGAFDSWERDRKIIWLFILADSQITVLCTHTQNWYFVLSLFSYIAF